MVDFGELEEGMPHPIYPDLIWSSKSGRWVKYTRHKYKKGKSSNIDYRYGEYTR